MHPDHFGHLNHRQRLEKRHAFVQELALPTHNFLGDVQDRLLPLMKALDEEFPGPYFLPDVFADFRRAVRLPHEVLVGVADAQVRDVLVVRRHDEIVAHFLYEHFR